LRFWGRILHAVGLNRQNQTQIIVFVVNLFGFTYDPQCPNGILLISYFLSNFCQFDRRCGDVLRCSTGDVPRFKCRISRKTGNNYQD
jgi:hypothetical protein